MASRLKQLQPSAADHFTGRLHGHIDHAHDLPCGTMDRGVGEGEERFLAESPTHHRESGVLGPGCAPAIHHLAEHRADHVPDLGEHGLGGVHPARGDASRRSSPSSPRCRSSSGRGARTAPRGTGCSGSGRPSRAGLCPSARPRPPTSCSSPPLCTRRPAIRPSRATCPRVESTVRRRRVRPPASDEHIPVANDREGRLW